MNTVDNYEQRSLVGRSIVFGFAAVMVGSCVVGCNLFNQHAQMMDAMRGVMSDTANRLGRDGQGMIQASGQVNNPGIRVEAGMQYFCVAKYDGVSGQISAGMSGKLDREVTDDVREAALKIWRNTSWSTEKRREAVMELLRPWNERAADRLFGDPPPTSQPSAMAEPPAGDDPNIPDPVTPKRVGLRVVRANEPGALE